MTVDYAEPDAMLVPDGREPCRSTPGPIQGIVTQSLLRTRPSGLIFCVPLNNTAFGRDTVPDQKSILSNAADYEALVQDFAGAENGQSSETARALDCLANGSSGPFAPMARALRPEFCR